MSRSYPHYDGWTRNKLWQRMPEKAPKCSVCDKPAFGFVTIQTSWFRSDDLQPNVCDRKAHSMQELIAAMGGKA